MYKSIRPLLFKLDPETAHTQTIYALKRVPSIPGAQWFLKQVFAAPPKPVNAFGLYFEIPVGLAAGYDKEWYQEWKYWMEIFLKMEKLMLEIL